MKWFTINTVWLFISLIGLSCGFALAPSTVGGFVARAGKISNTIKGTNAWKKLTTHPNSVVSTFPGRAIKAVREVVGCFNKEGRVIIQTPQGKLRGFIQTYKTGQQGYYYSFRGIRYGLPPIGARRFREALPTMKWHGIVNALSEGNSCPQRNLILDAYVGQEDCLFINVYSPKLPEPLSKHPKLPVMVWFHGGAFVFGSNGPFLYGPDSFVGENCILVAANYRLGALGFLNAGPDAPGNNGLKDQTLALKWVHKNIAAFGGDPRKVTIFGQSAGAASVHFHMLSPMSRGLFHRVIAQSGTALNHWTLIDKTEDRAFALGRALGLNTNSTDELLEFLRQTSARDIVEMSPKIITPEDTANNRGFPFLPSIETDWRGRADANERNKFDESFIVDHPSNIIASKNFNDVPLLLGYNSEEGLLFLKRLADNPNLLSIIDNNFIQMVPMALNVPGKPTSAETHSLAQEIKQFYLNNRSVSDETISEMVYLMTDLTFTRGIIESTRMHANYGESPVYMYRFGFDGSLGFFKRLLGITRAGVCHGDEIGYLFHFGFFNLNSSAGEAEILVRNRMVKMWTNFAKFANPTPSEGNSTLPFIWSPIDKTKLITELNYLDINKETVPSVNPDEKRLFFWDDLYLRYNGKLFH